MRTASCCNNVTSLLRVLEAIINQERISLKIGLLAACLSLALSDSKTHNSFLLVYLTPHTDRNVCRFSLSFTWLWARTKDYWLIFLQELPIANQDVVFMVYVRSWEVNWRMKTILKLIICHQILHIDFYILKFHRKFIMAWFSEYLPMQDSELVAIF